MLDSGRRGGQEEAHNNEEQPKTGTSRRRLIQGALGTVAAFAGGAIEVSREIHSRTESVHKMADFLRGKEGHKKVDLYGENLTRAQLEEKLMKLSEPNLSRQEATVMLDDFSYMIEIEDRFDKRFNTLPALEVIDQKVEKIIKKPVPLASSFGIGQINPQTALQIALERKEEMAVAFPHLAKNLEHLSKKNSGHIPDTEIVDMLGLRENGNVVLSFLAFQEVYNIYGRSTGGQVHGDMKFPDTRGKLHNKKGDPRTFSLAVAAYSATPISPMAAKAQVYLNEMAMFKAKSAEQGQPKYLDVDGSLGGETIKQLKDAAEEFGLTFPDALNHPARSKQESLNRIIALDAFLAELRPVWKKQCEELFNQNLEPKDLAQMVVNRYSNVTRMRGMLMRSLEGDPKSQKKLSDIFEGYIQHRKPDFLKLIEDEHFFNQVCPSLDYNHFISSLKRGAHDKAVRFDELYKGCIPTAYHKGGYMGLADDKNVMRRVTLGHELDPESKTGIVIDTKPKK